MLATATVGMGRRDDAERQFVDLEGKADGDEECALAALRRTENLYGLGRFEDAIALLEHTASTVRSKHWRNSLPD